MASFSNLVMINYVLAFSGGLVLFMFIANQLNDQVRVKVPLIMIGTTLILDLVLLVPLSLNL